MRFSISPFILIIFILFTAASIAIALINYQKEDYSFLDINRLIYPIEISLTSDNALKTELSFKILRNNLNDLRIAIANNRSNNQEVAKTEENLKKSLNFIKIIEDDFKNKKGKLSSLKVEDYLTELNDIIVSYEDLIGTLKIKNKEEISKRNLIALALIQNDIYDLNDDNKLNDSIVSAMNVKMTGVIDKEDKIQLFKSFNLVIPIDAETKVGDNLIGKNLIVEGVLESNPSKLIIDRASVVKENQVSAKTEKGDSKIKGFIKNFGREYIFISKGTSQKFLLSDVPWNMEDYISGEVLLVGKSEGSIFEIKDISLI